MNTPTWKTLVHFRLRTLLLAFTAATVWLGIYVNSARLQQTSVAEIQKYGGWVFYDFQFPSGGYAPNGFDAKASSWVPKCLLDHLGVDLFHSVVQVNLNYSDADGSRHENANRSDEALRYLRGFPKLRVLLLQENQASDDAMSNLAGLRKLQRLYMWDVGNITDAGMADLQGLKELRYIHISSSQITDKSLEMFGNMPLLEGLSLQFNHFTDEGLKYVAHLEMLQDLWLGGSDGHPNQITDAGIKQLEGLKNLTALDMQSTQVTPAGVAAFLRAVPGCKVYR